MSTKKKPFRSEEDTLRLTAAVQGITEAFSSPAHGPGLFMPRPTARETVQLYVTPGPDFMRYNPLTDDAQCFALAKTDAQLFAEVVAQWSEKGGNLNRMICNAFADAQEKLK